MKGNRKYDHIEELSTTSGTKADIRAKLAEQGDSDEK
jgi:hypothetical protein